MEQLEAAYNTLANDIVLLVLLMTFLVCVSHVILAIQLDRMRKHNRTLRRERRRIERERDELERRYRMYR